MTESYRVIAAELEREIRSGRLAPGTRLVPQRIFAYGRGIATSTASRVYGELTRKGLVVGETGRGSYVASPDEASATRALASIDVVDLAVSYPVLPGQGERLARSLAPLVTPASLDRHVRPPDAETMACHRRVAAAFLARDGWAPAPDDVAFAGNAREAVAAALAAVSRRDDRVGVEPLTFSFARTIADRLGIGLEPVGFDGLGATPDGIERLHSDLGIRVFLLQPDLHNPLGVSMDERRKREVAATLRRQDLFAVEDAANSFLTDAPPLAAFAPERVLLVDTLSKRVAPGMTVGMLAAPPALREDVRWAVRATAWTSTGWGLAAAVRLMEDGTAAALAAAKRVDASERQSLARAALDGLVLVGDPRAYHLWLELPKPWRSVRFEEAAARRGIAVSPSSLYAVAPGHVPAAVRLSIGTPDLPMLRAALEQLRALALAGPASEPSAG